MKKLLNYIIVTIILLLSLSTVQMASASVWDTTTVISPPVGTDVLPGGNIQSEGIKDSAIFSRILPFVISYAVRIAIAISVIVLIIGGYQYMTAYGSTEKQDTARKTITYAGIGLVIALTAYGIIAILTSIQLS